MKKFLFISAVALGLGLTSCSDYLDINTDPNSPSEDNLTSSMLMPAVEMNFAATYGDLLRIPAGYMTEQYAQEFGTSNYVDYSQFCMSATRSSSAYTQYTQRCLSNIKTILEKSEATNDYGTALAATVIRAMIYQSMVDCYGEIPYSEALDVDNVSPKYDDGADVYKGVIAELDAALANAKSTSSVCTNFLFEGETADPWIKLAKAIKFKMLMRESGVVDVKSQLDALIAEDDFPTSDVAYTDCWSNESGSMNPYYSEEFYSGWGSNQINVIANVALIGTMQTTTYTDPRLAAYFEPNKVSGEYVGGVSGTNMSTATGDYKSTDMYCRPVASYDMPLYLITVAEIEFFKAEYYARYGTAAQAEEHYNAAVKASFATAGVKGADECIAKYPYDATNYKKCIGIAKWVALSGTDNFESWCELRRLDYPTFGKATGSDIFNLTSGAYNAGVYEAGTLYTPIKVYNKVGENKLLERWPYPESSSSRNSNTPAEKGYTTPVFWGE